MKTIKASQIKKIEELKSEELTSLLVNVLKKRERSEKDEIPNVGKSEMYDEMSDYFYN